MNAVMKYSGSLIIALLLLVMSLGQAVYAQDPIRTRETDIPQWVIDRQQYETTYIYVPAEELQAVRIVPQVPQWVIDRQQYETTYVYTPSTGNVQTKVTPIVETTYQYIPSDDSR